jgi:hypothetical protein
MMRAAVQMKRILPRDNSRWLFRASASISMEATSTLKVSGCRKWPDGVSILSRPSPEYTYGPSQFIKGSYARSILDREKEIMHLGKGMRLNRNAC